MEMSKSLLRGITHKSFPRIYKCCEEISCFREWERFPFPGLFHRRHKKCNMEKGQVQLRPKVFFFLFVSQNFVKGAAPAAKLYEQINNHYLSTSSTQWQNQGNGGDKLLSSEALNASLHRTWATFGLTVLLKVTRPELATARKSFTNWREKKSVSRKGSQKLARIRLRELS